MPRLSIVIACPSDTEPFETTLASVLQHRPDDCEVIVVHPFAYSDPYDLAGEVRFLDAGSSADSWLGLVNAGLSAAQGEVIHTLEAGFEVEEGWADRALERFRDLDVAAVSPLIVPPERSGQRACAGIGHGWQVRRRVVSGTDETSQRKILGPSRSAGFYRGEMLRQVGGFDTALGEHLADLDLALTWSECGYRCVAEPGCRVRGNLPVATLVPSYANGQRGERLFCRHWRSRSGWGSVLIHPLAVALEAVGNLPRGQAIAHLLGRVSACLETGSARIYQRRLRRVRSAMLPVAESTDDVPPGQAEPAESRHDRFHKRAA